MHWYTQVTTKTYIPTTQSNRGLVNVNDNFRLLLSFLIVLSLPQNTQRGGSRQRGGSKTYAHSQPKSRSKIHVYPLKSHLSYIRTGRALVLIAEACYFPVTQLAKNWSSCSSFVLLYLICIAMSYVTTGGVLVSGLVFFIIFIIFVFCTSS